MKKFEYQVDRRSFLSKASLLLSSMGVAPLVAQDLLEKMARQIIPVAGAQTVIRPDAGKGIRRVVELCGRSGVSFLPIVTGKGMNFAPTATDVNFRKHPNMPWHFSAAFNTPNQVIKVTTDTTGGTGRQFNTITEASTGSINASRATTNTSYPVNQTTDIHEGKLYDFLQNADPSGPSLYMPAILGFTTGTNPTPIFNPLAKFANHIAGAQGIQTHGSGHTSMFMSRGFGVSAGVTPIVYHAATQGQGNLGVPGVNVARGNMMVNSTADLARGKKYSDLVDVQTTADFQNLFRRPVLRLTEQEVGIVTNAVQKLSSIQAEKLARKIADADVVKNDQQKAFDLMVKDMDIAGRTNTLMAQMTPPAVIQAGNPQGVNGGGGTNSMAGQLAAAVAAFEKNLTNAVTITYQSGDWHGRNAQGEVFQTQFGKYMSYMLGQFFEILATTPDPAEPGKTLWDTTVFVMTSEFGRGSGVFGMDNADGVNTSFLIAGPNIKGGFYGTTFSDNMGGQARHYGFDPNTGASAPEGSNNGPGQMEATYAYNTMAEAMGADIVLRGKSSFNCMLRKS